MKIQAVKAAIQKHIDREETGIKIFNHLSKVFEKFENKKISERMATALRKNLPDDCERAYLKRVASLIQIVVVKKSILNIEDRITFLLGYDNNPIFRQGKAQDEHSGFAYYNACHGFYALERNEQRRKLQDKAIYLAGIANTYETAKETVDNVKAELSNFLPFQMNSEMTQILGMRNEK